MPRHENGQQHQEEARHGVSRDHVAEPVGAEIDARDADHQRQQQEGAGHQPLEPAMEGHESEARNGAVDQRGIGDMA